MIQVIRRVDRETGTVTHRFENQGTDCEFEGTPCHAVELDGVAGEILKQELRLLGYQHIGCKVERAGRVGPTTHIEYWADPPAVEGSDA